MIRQLIILSLGLILLAGGYFIYQNRSKPALVSKQQENVVSNIKIGKYETLYKGGWEELNYLDVASTENPDNIYEVFSKAYPDLTDKNSEFFIKDIVVKNDVAEVYFGGDEEALTNRMGSSGPYIYTGLITFALTEDEKIKKVDFKLTSEGSHFGPTISSRDDYIYLWPTKILQDEAAKGNTKASETLKERVDTSASLPDKTSDWKTYTDSYFGYSLKYPNADKVEESDIMKLKDVTGNPFKQVTFWLDLEKKSFHFYWIMVYPSQKKDLETRIREIESVTVTEITDLTVSNLPAKKVYSMIGGIYDRQGVFIAKGEYIYSIVVSASQLNDTILNEYSTILSTFKFTQ